MLLVIDHYLSGDDALESEFLVDAVDFLKMKDLRNKKTRSALRVIMPNNFKSVVTITDEIAVHLKPWKKDKKFATMDNVLVVVVSDKTKDHLANRIYNIYGDVLNK